jgi:hypothetical protein
MDAAAITTQIEDLIKAHAAYLAKAPPYSVAEQTELIVRMEAAIERLGACGIQIDKKLSMPRLPPG